MKWEFIGKEELKEADTTGKGYKYIVSMWRTPVPGGWLIQTINAKSNDPQPMTSFYPDPSHSWSFVIDPQSQYLLRAAGPTHPSAAAEQLLRASNAAETKQIEE